MALTAMPTEFWNANCIPKRELKIPKLSGRDYPKQHCILKTKRSCETDTPFGNWNALQESTRIWVSKLLIVACKYSSLFTIMWQKKGRKRQKKKNNRKHDRTFTDRESVGVSNPQLVSYAYKLRVLYCYIALLDHSTIILGSKQRDFRIVQPTQLCRVLLKRVGARHSLAVAR